METAKTLRIRADASVSMGTGHVMRMIALAQAWQDEGGEAVFLCAEITPALEARLKEEGFLLEKIQAFPGSREDLEATCAAIALYGADSIPVAVDGYQFDADYQLGLKKAGCRLLVMDDYGHAAIYHADWVLNQNISAREELYASRAPHTRLLLGTKFALLRREFLKYRGWQRQIPEIPRKVLVTLGGADSDNVTSKIIQALAPTDVEVKVVVGGSNPHLPELEQAVENLKTLPAKIQLVVNPADMPGLMAWADLAIAAGGSTAWELAFMGLPSLFVILAENQVGIATELESAGFGVCLGKGIDLGKDNLAETDFFHTINAKFLHAVSSLGRKLVDGLGTQRMVSQIKELRLAA
jgi:UDP-2,4-diacetamido-2,4,6-trideoxy-beta-L-altropyranose hydrolase